MIVTTRKNLEFILLLRIFFRSLYVQAAWNFEKMQNLGFIYSIMPALKRIHGKNKAALAAAVERHLEFFNTHPYLTAPIIGATVRLEQDCNSSGSNYDNVRYFKSTLMGICGGVGDSFFWGAARPFAALIGILMAIAFNNFYAPLVCFTVYNIIHFSFRFSSFFLGYYEGANVINVIKKFDLRKQTERLKIIQAVLVGFLLALIKKHFMIYNFNTLFYNSSVYLGLALMVFGLYYLIKNNINPLYVIYIGASVVILVTYICKGV